LRYPTAKDEDILTNINFIRQGTAIDKLLKNLVVTKVDIDYLGFETLEADNGQKAIEMLGNNSFDLILMDIQMPVKDGYQTVSEIRREEAITGKHQTVIALSVNGLQADFYTATEMGMDDYITKPIDFKLLEERLSYWLLRN
jgi:CheY-like chemotaxis protein